MSFQKRKLPRTQPLFNFPQNSFSGKKFKNLAIRIGDESLDDILQPILDKINNPSKHLSVQNPFPFKERFSPSHKHPIDFNHFPDAPSHISNLHDNLSHIDLSHHSIWDSIGDWFHSLFSN